MTGRRGPSLAAVVAGILLVAACSVGAAVDPAPSPLDATRAGYVVVEADLHVHTRFSDGFLSPLDVVVHARRQGLGAIALTEHNVIFPARMARGWSRLVGGPEVIVGEEITTRDYHAGPILGLGTTLVFARSRSAADLVEALRDGRTVVAGPDGTLHGDPALVAAVEAEPLPARPPRDVRWDGQGLLDRGARVVACLALLALVALRRERTRSGSTPPPAVA